MTRTTFTMLGHFPEWAYRVRDHLIVNKKFHLVSPTDKLDFVIVGTERPNDGAFPLWDEVQTLTGVLERLHPDTPVLVLSTGDVYSDRDEQLKVSETKPMSEERGLVLSSTMESGGLTALYSILAESLLFDFCKHVLVLRVFDVYGPGLPGTVRTMTDAANLKQDIIIDSPGYQIRTFLHIDDVISAVDKLLPKFLGGARGIYNLGSTEEISLKRLADSVWQLTNPQDPVTPIVLVPPASRQVWWRVPDTLRFQALTGWKPSMTIRKGLWTLVND